METETQLTPARRPLLPWAVVLMAGVLALQLLPGPRPPELASGRGAAARSSALRTR